MANPERGEVELVAGDVVYSLALDMNAICTMQTRTGKTYGQLLDAVRHDDYVAFRDLLFTVLQRHHVKQFPTLLSVGELINTLPNGLNDAAKAIRQLIELNAERGHTKADGNGNPPTAQS